MCELVTRDRVDNGNIVLDGAGVVVPRDQTWFLAYHVLPSDEGELCPVLCRHPMIFGYSDWEPLPKPGPGQMIEVPGSSELALGILVDGRGVRDFTTDQWKRRTLVAA